MADSLSVCRPGTAYITITPALQGFYAVRGMWINGAPHGALSSMLGPLAWRGQVQPNGRSGATFYVTGEQLLDLERDIQENGPKALTPQQVAQTRRRLREAATRSGASVPGTTAERNARLRQPAGAPSAVPFEPLQCPAAGKAKKEL